MESNKLAPILLFAYNRPEHTRNLLQSLDKNLESKESLLYVFLDGPKNTEDKTLVTEVKKVVTEHEGFKQITIIERNENWGLAKNIIEGVTEVISKFKRVIVLEDDLIVAPYFLKFMNDALELYREEERVGHIQAYDFTQNKNLPTSFLIKWTGSWGWGTWERAWKLFNPNGKELLANLKSNNSSKQFDFNGTYPFTKMLERQIKGENDSWAIRWNATLFTNNILSLNAGRSLVDNRGFDGSGTHCGSQDIYKATLLKEPLVLEKIEPIEENREARKAFERYYKKTNGFIPKVKRRLQRIFKGDFSK